MKSLKTFNVDQDTIKILKRKLNKSEFVCRAVKALQKQQNEFQLADVNTKMMLNTIVTREDISQHLKKMIELELWG